MIEQGFWGRYTSSCSGTKAKAYAKSIELRFTDSGRTMHYKFLYKVHRFTPRSPIRWEAHILPGGGLPPTDITFTEFKPSGQEEEQTAVEWPDLGKLVMVEKYTNEPGDMTV